MFPNDVLIKVSVLTDIVQGLKPFILLAKERISTEMHLPAYQ